jgi:hypothetical protein
MRTNLFHSLIKYGDDTHFKPSITNEFRPTTAPAGSPEKIQVLAYRVERGLPLWHPLDGCQDEEVTRPSSFSAHMLAANL